MKAETFILAVLLVCIALTLSACTPQQIAEVDAHSKDVLVTFTTQQLESPQMINTFTATEMAEIINPYFSVQNSTDEIFRVDHAGNFYLYPLTTCGKLYTDGAGLLTCGTDADTNFTTTGDMTARWFNGSFNWTVGDDYNSFDGNILTFNTTKLSTVYYNANSSNLIAGTVNGGTIVDTQHPDGSYDSVTFNFTEASGSPGLDLRLNFTSIEDFSRGVIRYKTSTLAGSYSIIQVWNYDDSVWEDYPPLAQSLTFATITQPVFDSSEHLQDGIVQMRLYKASNGNTNNHYYVDWVSISKGYGVPSGEEIDPYSWHRASTGETGNFTTTGNVTAGYFFGNGSQLTGVSKVDTNTNCSVANSCPLLVYSTNTSWITANQGYNTTDDMFNAVDNGTFIKTDTDTNLTEDNVEAYIFDDDNTANLNMSSYNITMGDAILYSNSTCFVVKIDTTYLEVCE